MNNLWENSNTSAACESCGIDDAFFMPVKRTDMFNIRFQVPWNLILSNGGGMPVGNNVRLEFVDETGVNSLCNLGPAALSNPKFMWSRLLDSGLKVAEYQFYMPIPLADEYSNAYSHAYFDVSNGQTVKIINSASGADCEFMYGYDQTPAIFQEIRPGRLVFPYRIPGLSLQVELDGVPISIGYVYPQTICAHEFYNCFRVKLSINFSVSGYSKEYYSKPIKIVRGNEDTLRISTEYTGIRVDCNGYVHDGIMTPAIADLTRLFIRMPATLTKLANRVKRTYNSKCFAVRGERRSIYQLNSEPVPEWYASEVENVMLGKTILIDNTQLLYEGGESIFANIDVPGYINQYMDVSLASCKCEKIYSC